MANPEYFRDYYQRNKAKRLADAIKYQQDHKEERKLYMQKYYSERKSEWNKRTREQQDAINSKKRDQYRNDPLVRAKCIEHASRWTAANPEKRRAQHLRKYGLTLDCYGKMLKKQGGKCAICLTEPKRFHIDHCHATSKVRGLLCESCNLGLGKFYDNPESLKRAAVYLRASVRKKDSDK